MATDACATRRENVDRLECFRPRIIETGWEPWEREEEITGDRETAAI